MNALLLRCRYIFVPVTLFLISVLGFVAASPISAKAQQTTSTEPLWASHSLHLQFSGEQPSPLAMVNGDFDEDGVNDLVIGYALSKGGSIAVLRGNLDAHAPQTHASWLAAGRHQYAAPYLQSSKAIPVSTLPNLMTAADVNGDGHLDLVFATQGNGGLSIMLGDGKGNFLAPIHNTVSGGITSLAALQPGASLLGEAILAGIQTAHGATLAVLSLISNTLTTRASYALPGAATAMSVASLDADSIPDAAIVAAGKLLILHGNTALAGRPALTTLPIDDAESVTAGEFLFDRHAHLQLSVLTTSGDVVTLAHEGFDSRPYSPQQTGEMRRQRRRSSSQVQTLAQQAGNTGNAPWVEIERHSGAAVHASGDRSPILLRSRTSGSGGVDLVVINSSQQRQTVISHPLAAARSLSTIAAKTPVSQISSSNLATGNIVAAVSAPVTPDARHGLVLLSADSVSPEILLATTGNTFYVNTTADNTGTNTDPSDGIRCTQGSAEHCTLRDAVTFANNDAAHNISVGISDTVMVPAGTYSLTWQAGTFDGNGNGVTHLEVLGPITIIGDSSSDTIIDGNNKDVIFTINPGPVGSFNPSGESYVFDATLENLTIQNATNLNNPDNSATGNSNDVGGCINWDADGPGNLTIENSVIKNCLAMWGPGGGIWTLNSGGAGTGTLTLSGDTIQNNSTAEAGGGVFTANPPTAVTATNTVFSNNTARVSVNPSDLDSFGAGGGLYFSARSDATSTPRSTLTNVTVSSNTAGDDNGGGIYTNTGLLITSSLIENNTAKAWGGGIHSEVQTPETQTTITSSNFFSNSAAATGGAISGGTATAALGNILQVSLSRIFGNTSTSGASGLAAGVSGGQSGEVIATENWWGCNSGPTTASDGCDQAVIYNSSTGSLATAPYATLGFSSDITSIPPGGSMNLTLSLNHDSNNNSISGAFPAVATNYPFTFNVFGVTESPALTTGTFNTSGISTAVLTPTSSGNGTVTATFDNQTDTINFTSQAGTATSLSITAPPITFGQTASISIALSPSNATGITAADFTAAIDSTPLSITSTATPNVFILSGSALASPNGGSHLIQVNFAGTSSYSPSSASTSLQVNKATLNLTWTPTSPIVYGTTLSLAQLNATATFNGTPESGTFSYSSAFGTVLGVGTHTLTVSFTPSNTADFSTPTPITANVTVTQAAPVLAWSPTSPIVYGTPLSLTQFNATATHNSTPIAGTFSYSSAFGTVLGVGMHTLTVSFTPSDTTDYSTPAPITANITVNPATPVISWSPSSPIVYGTALSAAQLNATATNNGSAVAGTFNYSPALGTVLTAGTHTLTVSFTPSDTTDYSTPGALTKNITVIQGTPVLAWSQPSSIVAGTALSAAQLNATASYNGTPVAGIFSYNPALGTVLSAGTHTLTGTFTPSDTTDYATPAPITTNITILAIPVLAWSPTSPIVYGTPLSPAQFNATATFNGNPVTGTFSYSSTLGTVLGVGTHTLTVTFTPSDTTTYSTPAPITANIAVIPATPIILWSPSSPIVYGTALSAAQLNATATYNGDLVAGTFSYSPGLGTVLGGGTHTLTVTFTPTDTTTYNTPGPLTKNITVTQGTPVLAWSQPSPLVSGMALSATQLNATASYNGTAVAGTFSYNPALGTVLGAGTHTLTVTFTPSDSADYSTPAPLTTNITIQAIPVLAWTPTSPIVFGTALSPAQFNATATYNGNPVAGTFSYSSAIGTILGAGTHTLSATFTPTDTTTYITPTPITTNITVTPATPTLQWATPASITYGTALTGTQLNATATYNGNQVQGVFTYTTALGTVLSVGMHTLTATFTPSDTTDYKTPTGTVNATITVNPATPALQWAAPASIAYGTALTGAQLSATATNLGNPVSGTFAYTPALGTVLSVGSHTLSANFIPNDMTDYKTPTETVSTRITVIPVTPMLQWATPASITYGTALTNSQLNATASYNGSQVSGSFTYTPALGTVLSAGSHTLSATFIPSDTADYNSPTGTVSTAITVTAAMPILQWATPSSIPYGTALTNSQLNAMASYNGSQVSGSFTYTPALGTVLSAGSHTLSVSFTPADTTTYGPPAPITTNLIVNQDTLTITANNATKVYGTANPVFTGAITGELPVDSFTESFTTPAMLDSPVSSYPITPSVTGSNLTNYAVAAQSGILTVTPAGTTVTLSTTNTAANSAANVTLTATVLSATAGVPTGSVQFLDGSTVLGNGMLGAQGIGTYTTSSLASGVHQITAVYAGDTNFTGSSSSQSTVTIGSPGYTLLANPASLTLKAGQTGKVSLTFTPAGGFTGTLSLSCTGLPAGASCSFAPSNLTADGSNKQQIAQLTITTLGSNQGMVSMNRRDGASSGPLQASMFLLPGMFFGGFLMWQRKKLRVRNGQLLMLMILVASLTSMVGCGTSPTTTLGSSSVVVTATASAVGPSASNGSAAFTLTIVE